MDYKIIIEQKQPYRGCFCFKMTVFKFEFKIINLIYFNFSRICDLLYFILCGHPAQQHGRRLPLVRFSLRMRRRRTLVSSFLAEVTQQIHSLRASGVISLQVASAGVIVVRILRKSAGTVCTVPAGILVFVVFAINLLYIIITDVPSVCWCTVSSYT